MSEESEPDFDVIVVGAGIAGCVCAYQLARQGRSVLLIERGEAPGSKNLSGGVFYCRVLAQVFPDFLESAPVERRITRNHVCFLNEDSSVAIDYRDERLADPVNAVTVLRAKLDPWLAARCEEAGVTLMPGVRVEHLLTTPGAGGPRIRGVRAGEDEVTARVVIAADGVNSFLARDAGLRDKPARNQLAVGVKGVFRLPAQTIEERFDVSGDQGAAIALVGDCTGGVGGGGFCYTNRDSLSVGIVVRLDDLVAKRAASAELFDHFVSHPYLARLLAGAELVEYGSHLVAEGGLAMVGQTVADGLVVVGDAAGLTLNTGLTVRGMDLAAGSAIAAAEAVGHALERGDTSAASLAEYPRLARASFVGRDMRLYARAPHFLERPRMYGAYGQLLADVLRGAFDLDTTPRRHMVAVAWQALRRSPVRLSHLVGDMIAGVRAL